VPAFGAKDKMKSGISFPNKQTQIRKNREGIFYFLKQTKLCT